MSKVQRITPFLWFEADAEAAAKRYVSIFPNSKIGHAVRYDEAAAEAAGRPKGTVMTIEFELDGFRMTALNGGPHFKFNEVVSLVVNCANQAEVDHYWKTLSEGGDPKAQQCGWLKDRWGVSWQIVPAELPNVLANPKAMQAMLGMKKLDIDELKRIAAR